MNGNAISDTESPKIQYEQGLDKEGSSGVVQTADLFGCSVKLESGSSEESCNSNQSIDESGCLMKIESVFCQERFDVRKDIQELGCVVKIEHGSCENNPIEWCDEFLVTDHLDEKEMGMASLSSESEDGSGESYSESESHSESESDEISDNDENELEEGELIGSDAEETIGLSDDEGGDIDKMSFKPMNECLILPRVPPVNVTLEPHHQTVPLGVVLSILGAQVIIEGMEKHDPLSEGSILWITDTRSPLGMIEEIFGPVKNPYYVVRYNCEDEIPSGIQVGTLISFVSNFASHVLGDPNLYRKGYDAAADSDKEDSDAVEFSDDEKEAAYKKMIKQSKNRKGNNKKGGKVKSEFRKHEADQPVTQSCENQQSVVTMGQFSSHDHANNCPSKNGTGQNIFGGIVSPFQQVGHHVHDFMQQQSGVFNPPSQSGVFNPPPQNEVFNPSCMQYPGMAFPNASPAYGMMWLPQPNFTQTMPHQMHLFQQGPHFVQPNGPTFAPCPNAFNQTQHGQNTYLPNLQMPNNFNMGGAPCNQGHHFQGPQQ